MSKRSIRIGRALGMSLGVALLLSFVGWFGLSQAALAQEQPLEALATITVNTNNPAIVVDGQCSLVEAVENANADAQIHADCASGAGDDIILLPTDAAIIFAAAHNAVDGSNALPVITSTITIWGNGATLIRDTNAFPFRFFNVADSGNLTLEELGLRNGRVGLVGTLQLFLGGGAILNQGTLTVNSSNLSHNHASFGGAIYNESITGTLMVNNSTFSFNQADSLGGALYTTGSGVVSGGLFRYNQATSSGGAILQDSGHLTVTNSTVLDNMTAGSGAGIVSRATVTDSHLWIRSTNVVSNVAAVNAGGLYNTASNGLTSIVEIDASSLTGNRADSTALAEGIGGAVVNGWTLAGTGGVAQMYIRQSTVQDNVGQTGGGIANIDVTGYSTRTATLFVSQSTLARNTAAGIGSERGTGGALYNSNGVVTVANSTFSANQALGDDAALGGRGGAIGNVGRGITTTLNLLNSTLAFNQASQAGGAIAVLGQVTSTVTSIDVGNTLIVSNVLSVTESPTNTVVLAAIASPQVIAGTESCSIEAGSASSLGGNIEDQAACGLNTATDLQNTAVALGALTNNGGSTSTHLIMEDGPAFDGGVDALCAAAPVSGVDQRGIARPQGESCDVGAVELEPTEPGIRYYYFPKIGKYIL